MAAHTGARRQQKQRQQQRCRITVGTTATCLQLWGLAKIHIQCLLDPQPNQRRLCGLLNLLRLSVLRHCFNAAFASSMQIAAISLTRVCAPDHCCGSHHSSSGNMQVIHKRELQRVGLPAPDGGTLHLPGCNRLLQVQEVAPAQPAAAQQHGSSDNNDSPAVSGCWRGLDHSAAAFNLARVSGGCGVLCMSSCQRCSCKLCCNIQWHSSICAAHTAAAAVQACQSRLRPAGLQALWDALGRHCHPIQLITGTASAEPACSTTAAATPGQATPAGVSSRAHTWT